VEILNFDFMIEMNFALSGKKNTALVGGTVVIKERMYPIVSTHFTRICFPRILSKISRDIRLFAKSS
jgi:hypothetical protein